MANEQLIFRSRKTGKDKYTPIDNINVLQNRKLSLKERGLLVFLLSLPDDWVVNKRSLFQFSDDGRDAAINAFNDLIKKKYIQILSDRDKNGKFSNITYMVHETPYTDDTEVESAGNPTFDQSIGGKSDFSEQPLPENPAPGNPAPGNQALQSNNEESNNSSERYASFFNLNNKNSNVSSDMVGAREEPKEKIDLIEFPELKPGIKYDIRIYPTRESLAKLKHPVKAILNGVEGTIYHEAYLRTVPWDKISVMLKEDFMMIEVREYHEFAKHIMNLNWMDEEKEFREARGQKAW